MASLARGRILKLLNKYKYHVQNYNAIIITFSDISKCDFLRFQNIRV